MKKTAKIIIILLIFVSVILEIASVYFMNKISADSIYAENLKKQINEYSDKNSMLNVEVLKYSSFQQIFSRAKDLGFVEPKEFILLSSPLTIAANNNEQP